MCVRVQTTQALDCSALLKAADGCRKSKGKEENWCIGTGNAAVEVLKCINHWSGTRTRAACLHCQHP